MAYCKRVKSVEKLKVDVDMRFLHVTGVHGGGLLAYMTLLRCPGNRGRG